MRRSIVALALLLGFAAATPVAFAAQPAIPSDIAVPGGSGMLPEDGDWRIFDVVFTPDGTRIIASGGYADDPGGRITLLDAATGKVIKDRTTAGGDGLVMSPRGDRVLLTVIDSIMDTTSGALIAKLPVDAGSAAAFSPDGSRLFLVDDHNRIVAYDTATLSPVVTGTPIADTSSSSRDRGVEALAISPSGDRLVSTSGADGLRSFDPTTLTLLAQAPPMTVRCPAFSPGGDRVFAITRDKLYRDGFSAFDASSLALLSTVPLDWAGSPPCPLVSLDGSRAYVSVDGGYGSTYDPIMVIDTSTMTTIGSIKPRVKGKPLLALTPDGSSFWQYGKNGALLATPVASMTSTLPPVPWAGRYDDWKALPEVGDVENRISRLLAGSFYTKGRAYCCEDEYSSRWKDVIHTPASTRVQDYKRIAYWSATEVCTRPITKRSPATIAQDRRAIFTCRPRSTDPSELDPVQELLAHTPVRHLEMTAEEQQSCYVVYYPTATQATAHQHCPESKGLAVQDRAAFTQKGPQQATLGWGWFYEYWADIFTRNVPKLPSVASLRRAQAT